MAVIAWPSWPPRIKRMTFGLESNVAQFVSPVTKATQRVERSGARWRASVNLAFMSETNTRLMRAFLTKLQDEAGTFYWNEYFNSQPAVVIAGSYGTPLVNGASQTGRSLITDGWAAAKTLQKGEYIAFENGSYRELHMATADAVSDGTGNMTISIVPAIRISPANNAVILLDGQASSESTRAAGEFILDGNFTARWNMEDDMVAYAFECVEPLTVTA